MSIELSRQPGFTIIKLAGRLNASVSNSIEERALDTISSCTTPVIVDISDIDYMSSEGLRLLMLMTKKAKSLSLPLVVAEPAPLVQEVFEISMFTRILDICPTIEQAIHGFQP